MRWIAELEQPEPATAHAYNIKMTGENGTEMSWGSEYTMSTKFKVNFPKTLYKDANRNITYNVKIQLWRNGSNNPSGYRKNGASAHSD